MAYQVEILDDRRDGCNEIEFFLAAIIRQGAIYEGSRIRFAGEVGEQKMEEEAGDEEGLYYCKD